jgi:shikimate kinase
MRLCLVGYRACGKTTIGRLVAARLGWPYLDLDTALEASFGMPIADFFAAHGEAAFRDREAAALAAALATPGPQVLATGGGCVVRSENRGILRASSALVVYLAAPAEVLQERLRRHAGGRPSLTGAAVADEVARVLAVREPFYREVAHAVVRADRTPDEVADELVRLVENATKASQNRG